MISPYPPGASPLWGQEEGHAIHFQIGMDRSDREWDRHAIHLRGNDGGPGRPDTIGEKPGPRANAAEHGLPIGVGLCFLQRWRVSAPRVRLGPHAEFKDKLR